VVDGPEAVGLELGVVNLVLVILVEDEVQDALGLYFSTAVGCPDLQRGQLIKLVVVMLKLRHND
jgi:hypothetical protein